MEKRVIEVAKVPKRESNRTWEHLLAEFCYHYQQYTFEQARKLPYRKVKLLLGEARRQKAKEYFILTQIAVAPHTRKSATVKKLLDHFKEQMEDIG